MHDVERKKDIDLKLLHNIYKKIIHKSFALLVFQRYLLTINIEVEAEIEYDLASVGSVCF